MKDKAKEIAIPAVMTIPKVKGRTRIELTNANTGKKKVIEHENTFQSAILAKQLRALSAADNNPFANSTWAGRPLWRNLCGGILLFRDAIDLTNGDVEYMPASNLMVANGAYGVENNGNPPELGSYNSIESSTSGRNSLSFVYDWGTSQGNGTIGCICLTSEVGGYVGYGNASGYNATLRNIFENQESNNVGAHAYYDGKRIRIVDVDYTAKKITVAKSNDCITIASIFQGQNEVTSEISFEGTPLGSGTGSIFYRAASESEICIFRSAQADVIQNGESKGLLFYDFTDDTAEVVTIINTSGATLQPYRTTYQLGVTRDANGNIYIPTQGDNLAMFDDSGVFVRLYNGIGGSMPTFGNITADIPCAANGTSAAINMIYGANARPTNGSMPSAITYFSGIDALCRQPESRIEVTNSKLMPYKNPLYLATVNNLATAVVKDNTQTMKVIYTLTEA